MYTDRGLSPWKEDAEVSPYTNFHKYFDLIRVANAYRWSISFFFFFFLPFIYFARSLHLCDHLVPM